MKKSILILPLAALLFAACDKISADQYTMATGGSGGSGWTNGGTQHALVEKYTGPRCVNCPNADITLDALHLQYGDQLVVISINHPVGQGEPFPNQPDLRTEVGSAWDTYFGINAIPAAYLNRDASVQYSGNMENIGSAIGAVVAHEPDVDLTLSAQADTASRQLDIDVNVHVYNSLSGALTITLALTEDSLVYRQSTPDGIVNDYVHNHMLREVLTATWGDELPLVGNAGEVKAKHFTCTVTNSDIKLENCHVVAFISQKESRQVLNCNQTSLTIAPSK